MTDHTTRAERMAQPTTRAAIRAVAEAHGACVRPIQVRRIDQHTGAEEQILIPCGATLASLCSPCAERAKSLRATQCREGWHLDHEPVPEPPPPDDRQMFWIEQRAEAQAARDHAAQAGDDTAELDKLIGDLDGELTRSSCAAKPPPAAGGPGGTGPPAAAKTPRTCPSGRSAHARSARPTPPATGRCSGPRCLSR